MSDSLAGQAASIFLGLGALVAFASWFQMRLEENERLGKTGDWTNLPAPRANRPCLTRRNRKFFRRAARANSSRNFCARLCACCCCCWKPAAHGCSGVGLPKRPTVIAPERAMPALVAVRHFRAAAVFARTFFRDDCAAGKPPAAAARREFSAGRRVCLLCHRAGHRGRQGGISQAGFLGRARLVRAARLDGGGNSHDAAAGNLPPARQGKSRPAAL